MSRNIVPRTNKDADLGTAEKNWNRLFTDAVILRGNDLQALLNGKTDLDTLTAKGDLYVATNAGVITRLPAGTDGYVLKSNSGDPKGLMWGPAGARQELTGNITVTVGSGGDFPTINAALENIAALYYPKHISGEIGSRVIIKLLSGFVMSEQVFIKSLDLSWITIIGEDTETVINRSALTTNFRLGYPAFVATDGGFLPIISQLFNMDTSGDGAARHGILAYSNSRAIVSSNCGVKNAGAYSIIAYYGSTIKARGADASGAGGRGITANYSSTVEASNVNASGAGDRGIVAFYGSTIEASGADASGAGENGIVVLHGSIISAYNATGTLNQTANTITSLGIIFR